MWGRYLAGVWSDSFCSDLLWARKDYDPKPRPEQYIAPSWSWASVSNGIRFTGPDLVQRTKNTFTTHCRLVGTKCLSLTSDNLTDLRGSYITLSGPAIQGQVQYEDEALEVGLYKSPLVMINYLDGGESFLNYDYDLLSGGPGRVDQNEPVICLLVMSRFSKDIGQSWDHFLVLRSSKGMGDYERIGIVEGCRPFQQWPWVNKGREVTVTIF